MTGNTEDAKALRTAAISSDAVAEWLKQHPGFLNERPDVMARLVPADRNLGDGVADMQRFMLDRLQRELHALTAREKNLLAAAEANADSQGKIHQAACAALDARSMDGLLDVIEGTLPKLFDIAAARLCIEKYGDKVDSGCLENAVMLPPGAVGEILPGDRAVSLRADTKGDERIFGDLAQQIRSMALMRIDLGESCPPALLALGARARDGFDPRQGTELLSFLTRVVRHCVQRWLGDAD